MYQDQNPYAVNNDMFAVDAALSERLAFLRKVYLHVFGAMMIFGSIAQLFRHILFLLMRFSDD